MAGKQRNSGARQHVACCLAIGQTIRDTAEQVGVSESAIYAWLRDETFRRSIEELRSQAVSEAVSVLGATARKAALTLADLLDSESEGIRIRAATSLLDQLSKYRTLLVLEDRIANLESRLTQQGNSAHETAPLTP